MRDRFLYGAATSAHQVEGNNVHSDWWAWEQRTPGITSSGRATDHYHRFQEDFALARSLGHTAHRLSVEWARIEPKRGEFDKRELAHYREVVRELKRNGLASFVTLHHFTSPQWFARSGGWLGVGAVERYVRYVRTVAEHLGDLVDFWITLNEPMVYITQSYWHKRWPPRKRSAWAVWRLTRRMALAHRKAFRALHSTLRRPRVGLAKNCIAYEGRWATLKDYWFNHYFMGLTARHHDFIGVNYYFMSSDEPWRGAESDLHWPIRPEGLTRVLLGMRRYGVPLYVTENGLADAQDSRRADFIRDHLRALEDAQAQGADVRGYLHWSLLDNFEWDLGFEPRFGLVEVDYATMKRTPRPSAYVYKAIIEQSMHAVYRVH